MSTSNTTVAQAVEPSQVDIAPAATGNGAASSNGSAGIANSVLAELRTDFGRQPELLRAQNAVTAVGVKQVSRNHQAAVELRHEMSHRLDDWKATNQKKSGRCWLFAATNLLRAKARKSLGLKEFELSQNYLFFYDKLERANYFLEQIQATADRPVDDRLVSHLLGSVLDDGGQWDMIVNLVSKYGVVPVTVMPETHSSADSHGMNVHLISVARAGAHQLREASSSEQAAEVRADVLARIYRVLSVHLGTPPTEFEWQWTDDEKEFHRRGRITPVEFLNEYVGFDLAEYVCVVDDPRPEHPQNSLLEVEHVGNVLGGRPIRYLNVGIESLRELCAAAISDGEPVWFGCDCEAQADDDAGQWHENLYDYWPLYGVEYTLNKEQRLRYGDSAMVHAMLFTGVDLHDGAPRAWRVENSWGVEKAQEGFYTMSDGWFGEYVFEAVVHRDRLDAAQLAALKSEPIRLAPWDPMGMLA